MHAFIAPLPRQTRQLSRPFLTQLSPLRNHGPRARNATTATPPARMCATPPAPTTTRLETFLRAAGGLGTLRFIAITDGSVLETVGRLDYDIKTFDIPKKGRYLTIASIDKCFECHINTSKVKEITMSSEEAKMGGHDLHVIRLLGGDGGIVLSLLLMWDPAIGPGNYLHGAVERFQELKERFGERFEV